jgi:hypothetical protein
LIILIVGAVIWASQGRRVEEPQPIETSEPTNGPLVGGDRDEYGCLGPAGYRFDEEIEACIRDWELDENQGRAAKIVVTAADLENPTVVEVLSARCPGCFSVTLDSGKNRVKFQLENWQVVDRSMTPEECIQQGGRAVNIVGGAGCESGEEEIGEVTGFISPNVCCKARK